MSRTMDELIKQQIQQIQEISGEPTGAAQGKQHWTATDELACRLFVQIWSPTGAVDDTECAERCFLAAERFLKYRDAHYADQA